MCVEMMAVYTARDINIILSHLLYHDVMAASRNEGLSMWLGLLYMTILSIAMYKPGNVVRMHIPSAVT